MSYYLRFVFIPVLLLAYCSSFAQYNIPENKVWIFDANNGITFDTLPPQGITSNMCYSCVGLNNPGENFEQYAPGASVCDASGQLLFYTDGSVIWDRTGQKMIGSYPTLGASSFMARITNGVDGALITMMPENPGKYFVFSLTDEWNNYPGPGFLYYSMVDTQLNGGLGDVIPGKRWILLDSNLAQRMTAVPGNNCNVWLIVHSDDTNMFKAYEITWQGINPNPVISYTGVPAVTPWYDWDVGQITMAPSRTSIVSCYRDFVELYDFDPATGIVSNGWVVDSAAGDGLYGVCFSPDNSKLYVTRGQVSPVSYSPDCAIDELDLSLPTHEAIKLSLFNVAGASVPPYYQYAAGGELRLGPNGIIYFASVDGTPYWYNTIEQPDSYGMACQANLDQNEFPTANTFGGSPGMGNEPVKAIPSPHADTAGSIAQDTCVLFDNGWSETLHAPQGDFLTYVWNNGSADTMLKITKPGKYWVTCTDRCMDATIDTFVIKILPVFTLGNDTTVCFLPITLKAGLNDVSYLWSTGSIVDSTQVTSPGTYWASASAEGCSYTDSIQVSLLTLHQDLGNDTLFCREAPFQMSLSANVPVGADAIWSTGSTSPGITVTDTGSYWVSVTELQCEGSDTIHVGSEKCDCHFGVPSAFTPNGDGKNDVFRLVLEPDCPVQGYLLSIYNRWGQLVYTGTNAETGWDGTFNGQMQDIGTYMYTIDFTVGTEGIHHYQKGDVTLIR